MRRVLLALSAVALFGCPGDSSTSSDSGTATYVGTYTLVTVGGAALPAASGDPGQTITAGALVINANGTFSYGETRNPGGLQTSPGTYTVSGLNITYVPTQQGDTGATGVFSSNTYSVLTVTPSGEPVLVFHKQ